MLLQRWYFARKKQDTASVTNMPALVSLNVGESLCHAVSFAAAAVSFRDQ